MVVFWAAFDYFKNLKSFEQSTQYFVGCGTHYKFLFFGYDFVHKYYQSNFIDWYSTDFGLLKE